MIKALLIWKMCKGKGKSTGWIIRITMIRPWAA